MSISPFNGSFNHALVDEARSTIQQRLADAQSSKDAGNTALQLDQPRQASFHYKKVFLYLAEYLDPNMAVSSCSPDGSNNNNKSNNDQGGDGNAGLIELLSRNRGMNGGGNVLTHRALMETTATPTAMPSHSTTSETDVNTNNEEKGTLNPNTTPTTTNNNSSNHNNIVGTLQEQVYLLYGLTLNNLTLAHLRLGRYREGAQAATCVLERVPGFANNTKALLRRARCYIKLNELERAASDVAVLQTQKPVDVGVAPVAEELRVAQQACSRSEKKMYQNMFAAKK